MKHTTPKHVTDQIRSIGIQNADIYYQLSPEKLQQSVVKDHSGIEIDNGTLAVLTGKFTGRSPKDRYIVKDTITNDKVWWGDINIPFDSSAFDLLLDDMKQYLSGRELFVRDCFACADKKHQKSIRVINQTAWANLFVSNMFISPDESELSSFHSDWLLINAPDFVANPKVHGTRSSNFSILNFTKKTIIIGGTGYTGEIKKAVFSALNFILPIYENTLPMHCSANVGNNGKTALFFGLSGTGKTTLSADVHRKLIGDDEHGWTVDHTIFNFEGGCYAKVIGLSKDKEPEIFHAIRKGALLENVVVDINGKVDYDNSKITQNTRVSYPLHFIENTQTPSIGKHPKNIFFLTADAFGVLPPISKLSPEQAAYHFISGYTAKIAGTEAGIEEPEPSFSACFGAPFMPLHPSEYATLLSDKIRHSHANVWLVNTGWQGGSYGVGSRIKLRYTRAMVNAALEGYFDDILFRKHPVFGLKIPTQCPNVPDSLMNPIQTWKDPKKYNQTAQKLVRYFIQNFKKFENKVPASIQDAGPKL